MNATENQPKLTSDFPTTSATMTSKFDIWHHVNFKNGRAACPACVSYHGKKSSNTNLSLVPGSDGAYKCHRGCTPEEIRSALNYQPETKPEWTPEGESKPIPKPASALYAEAEILRNYNNLETGKTVGVEARKWLDDRGITAEIRQHFQLGLSRRRYSGAMAVSIDIPFPDGNGKYYRKGRIAPWTGEKGWTQYGIPQHVFWTHKPQNFRAVWLCAGEWDAMLLGWKLREQSEIAICSFTCGEGSVPPADRIAELQGKPVTIFYDRDEAGEKGAAKVGAVVASAQIAEVPAPQPVPPGWDITDFLRAGYPIELLYQAAEATKAASPTEAIADGKPKKLRDRLVTNDELIARAPDIIEYLVPDLMTSNELFLLATAPRGGKTLLAMTLAHAVATGGKFLGRPCTQGSVIYVNLEDADAKIKERELQQGWGEGLPIYWLDKFKLAELPELIEAAAEIQPRLIVLDTLSRIKDATTSEASAEMSQVLEPLQEFAKLYDCAVLLVHHTKKVSDAAAAGAVDVFDSIRGSSAIRATARGAWILAAGERSHRLIVEHGHGRYDLDIYLNLKNLTWLALGNWKPDANADQSDRILAYLNARGSGTISEIAEAMAMPKSSCQKALWKLQQEDMVLKKGGHGCSPATYSRSQIQSAQSAQICTQSALATPYPDGDTSIVQTKNQFFSSKNQSTSPSTDNDELLEPKAIAKSAQILQSDRVPEALPAGDFSSENSKCDRFDPILKTTSAVCTSQKEVQSLAGQAIPSADFVQICADLSAQSLQSDRKLPDRGDRESDRETAKSDRSDREITPSVDENDVDSALMKKRFNQNKYREGQWICLTRAGEKWYRDRQWLISSPMKITCIESPFVTLADRKGKIHTIHGSMIKEVPSQPAKPLEIGDRVRLTEEAIAQKRQSLAKSGQLLGDDEQELIYELAAIDKNGMCTIAREGQETQLKWIWLQKLSNSDRD